MSGKKLKVAFEIRPDSFEMLLRAAEQYKIPDPSKALRCLLDYARRRLGRYLREGSVPTLRMIKHS
jgi:hypothetical protein